MRVPNVFDMSRKPLVGDLPEASGSDARRERTMQRLQIGITGVVLMVLLIGLASVIQDRANLSDATAVPEAAPTTEPTQAAPQNDPLAEAGVVPDMLDEPPPAPTPQTSEPGTTIDAASSPSN